MSTSSKYHQDEVFYTHKFGISTYSKNSTNWITRFKLLIRHPHPRGLCVINSSVLAYTDTGGKLVHLHNYETKQELEEIGPFEYAGSLELHKRKPGHLLVLDGTMYSYFRPQQLRLKSVNLANMSITEEILLPQYTSSFPSQMTICWYGSQLLIPSFSALYKISWHQNQTAKCEKLNFPSIVYNGGITQFSAHTFIVVPTNDSQLFLLDMMSYEVFTVCARVLCNAMEHKFSNLPTNAGLVSVLRINYNSVLITTHTFMLKLTGMSVHRYR